MVSAVFHNPLEARDAARAESRDSTVKPTAAPEANTSHPSPTMTSTAAPTPVAPRAPIDWVDGPSPSWPRWPAWPC